jgi:DNA polymerase-3 subunit epsilon
VRAAAQRSFDELGTPLFEVPFCVLDVETTGGSPADSAITELGALRFQGGECVGTFHTLVNPGCAIPPFITILTGITQPMVVEAPAMGEVLPSFLEFLGEAVVVGHNVRFDLRFLNAAALELGYGRLPNRWVDTAGLARRLIREEVRNLRLETLAAHLRSPHRPSHRAFEDARATAWVFHALLERAGTLGVTALEDLLELPTARGAPHYSKIRLADALPRRPGVYLFRDRTGAVFYVGKAKNLRSRVRSYFYGDERRTVANMLRELARIEHRVCETELEAEITELRLLHAHRPRHNRRSKPARAPHWVKLTDEAFPRLSLVRRYREDGCLHLGPFRGRRRAEVVLTALWDALPIRRCASRGDGSSGACAFAQLGVALCPCEGAVDRADYAGVVERLRAGIEDDPSLLLDPLAERMTAHARAERYEEAARLRDRHRALSRAVERRRAWQALCGAGLLSAQTLEGEAVLVERGRLVAAWGRPGRTPLFQALPAPESPAPQVPSGIQEAEEAHLLWQWLSEARLIDCSGVLSLPIRPVPAL